MIELTGLIPCLFELRKNSSTCERMSSSDKRIINFPCMQYFPSRLRKVSRFHEIQRTTHKKSLFSLYINTSATAILSLIVRHYFQNLLAGLGPSFPGRKTFNSVCNLSKFTVCNTLRVYMFGYVSLYVCVCVLCLCHTHTGSVFVCVFATILIATYHLY